MRNCRQTDVISLPSLIQKYSYPCTLITQILFYILFFCKYENTGIQGFLKVIQPQIKALNCKFTVVPVHLLDPHQCRHRLLLLLTHTGKDQAAGK